MSPRISKRIKANTKRKFDLRITLDSEGDPSKPKKYGRKALLVGLLFGALIPPAIALMGYGAWSLLRGAAENASLSDPDRTETNGELGIRWTINVNRTDKGDRLDIQAPNDVVHDRFIDVEPKVAIPVPRRKPPEIAAREAPVDTHPERAIGPRAKNKCDDARYKNLPAIMNPCLDQPLNIKPPQ
jgi:hypothetical protein